MASDSGQRSDDAAEATKPSTTQLGVSGWGEVIEKKDLEYGALAAAVGLDQDPACPHIAVSEAALSGKPGELAQEIRAVATSFRCLDAYFAVSRMQLDEFERELEGAWAAEAAGDPEADIPIDLSIARGRLEGMRGAEREAAARLAARRAALGAELRSRLEAGAAPVRADVAAAIGELERPAPLPADPRDADLLTCLLALVESGRDSPLAGETLLYWTRLPASRIGMAEVFAERFRKRKAVARAAVPVASAALYLASKAAILGLLGDDALERALLAGDSISAGFQTWVVRTAMAYVLTYPLAIAYASMAQPWRPEDGEPTLLGFREMSVNAGRIWREGASAYPLADMKGVVEKLEAIRAKARSDSGSGRDRR
eukprot:tig00000194_g14817.t1